MSVEVHSVIIVRGADKSDPENVRTIVSADFTVGQTSSTIQGIADQCAGEPESISCERAVFDLFRRFVEQFKL